MVGRPYKGAEQTGNLKKREIVTQKPAEKSYQHEFFQTTGVDDFKLKVTGNPPPGYPEKPVLDVYSPIPFLPDYEKRKEALLDHCCRNPSGGHIKGFYYELARLYRGSEPVYNDLIKAALNYINQRYDCSDFVLLGIIRILYQFFQSDLLTDDLKSSLVDTVLEFKYHPEEPGIDSMCTWTENHQIMFAANAYLAGQKFPERIFSNSGETGRQKMQKSKARILKWLEMRFLTGFSEWLSHVYYDEDITALINLIDFCEDREIVDLSSMVLDLVLLDMALNSFHGAFGCSHGRSYAVEKKDALKEATIDTQKLLFGKGIYSGKDNMGAVSMALSDRYKLPDVIYKIANDEDEKAYENRQRMSIKIKEAERWGLSFDDSESGMILLSMESYAHPKTIGLVMRLFDEFGWWENQFFSDFSKHKRLIGFLRKTGLLPLFARIVEKDITRNTREEVNLYTYKTPDYLLSSAQDYRKGYGGDQQHIWQATLGPKSVCFTTHPGCEEDISAGYWVGSGTLPRVAQLQNVLIACYNISKSPGIYLTNKLFFTHAWFPKEEFDEVMEKNGWIFARKNEGYIALFSQNGYHWQLKGEDKNREVIAEGQKNIWICEMGRKQVDGSFHGFVSRVSGNEVKFSGQKVAYHTSSLGLLQFGWKGDFRQNGKVVNLKDYPRYENPYCKADFAANEIRVKKGDQQLILNLEKRTRTVSQFAD